MRANTLFTVLFFVVLIGLSRTGDAYEVSPENPMGERSCDNSEGLPPVGSQEVPGSCYAWAAAYYHLTHLQWQEYGWDVNDPTHQCSPSFVYNLTNGGVDNGANEGFNARADAFNVLETMGCATMADMPYSSTGYRVFPSEAAFRNGMMFRTLSTETIDLSDTTGLTLLKSHLLEGNTAVIGIYGYGNFDNLMNYDNVYCVSEAYGSRLYWHDVCVVGFDDDLETADGTGAFRIVNSFGPYWGDNGFFWMSYEAVMSQITSYRYALYAVDRIEYSPEMIGRIETVHGDRYALRYRFGIGDPDDPDTTVTYFDFDPMSLANVPYPDGAGILLDITDVYEKFEEESTNTVFLKVLDIDAYDGNGGTLYQLWLEDIQYGCYAMADGLPLTITDQFDTTNAYVSYNGSLEPPTGLAANVDPGSGLTTVTWIPPTGTGLTGYRIYLNGSVAEMTTETTASIQLPEAGTHWLAVAAEYGAEVSSQPLISVFWANSYGIPFADDFETGWDGWMAVGSSGYDPEIVDDPAHDGTYAVGIRSRPEQDMGIARGFPKQAGIALDAWFNMARWPASEMGVAGCAGFVDSLNTRVGVFVNSERLLSYTVATDSAESIVFDPPVMVDRNRWFMHRIRYVDGMLHTMVLTDTLSVISNEVVDIPDIEPIAAFLICADLNYGWNYFDDFKVEAYSGPDADNFSNPEMTSSPYAIVIRDVLFADGNSLSTGSEFAVFDENECVGTASYNGSWPILIDAWGEVDSDIGFVDGNTMRFEIWHAEGDSISDPSVITDVGNGTFGEGLYAEIRLSIGVVEADHATGVRPMQLAMFRIAPNPCSSTARVRLAVPEDGTISLRLYDLCGRLRFSSEHRNLAVGYHDLVVPTHDVNSGMYVLRASHENAGTVSRRIAVVK